MNPASGLNPDAPGRLLAIHDGCTSAAFAAAVVALAVLLGSFVFEICARYFFNAPTRWSSDVVQYALCVSAALALPTVTREGGHVALTTFIEKLPAGRRPTAQAAIVWIGVAALAVTTVVFVGIAVEQAGQGIETVAAFPIPKWWLTAVVAFGLFDSGLHLLRQALGFSPLRTGQESEL